MMRPAPDLDTIRTAMRADYLPDEAAVVRRLAAESGLGAGARAAIAAKAAELIRRVRETTNPGLMESFLAEYGLSTKEGVALMCLAEALLRVPDAETIDALIEDKIAPSDWGKHLGHSASPLVNASTWALMLTGKVLAEPEGLTAALRGAVKRLGEPVIRTAVGQAMRELGRNFVLGRTIEEAQENAAPYVAKGYTYSYDMLGEAARTEADARHYHLAYSDAITALAGSCTSDDIRENPGISVKLSALHARYEFGQRDRVMAELTARTRSLALLAKSANMGFNIDAEEADRLDLSLDVIEAVLSDPSLSGWDGFGVVVQAYGPRAGHVIDWLYALATRLDRKIMVRLVKGAYWDTEIKRAQVMGLKGFPVFTRKVSTDVSYIASAEKLLAMTDRIYPQFATHNAHTVSAVLEMAASKVKGNKAAFEFQRLHGMGETLHAVVLEEESTRCRIYAPVGAHRDLLAYLVRRLLENGANSSFVNQIVDESIAPEAIAQDPFDAVAALGDGIANPGIRPPAALFGAGRVNAKGWDITDPEEVAALDAARAPFRDHTWQAGPMIAGPVAGATPRNLANPAQPAELVGRVTEASAADVETALAAAPQGFADWSARPAGERAAVLRKVADLYEAHAPEFFALAAREAGKSLLDGVAEVREAVDFLRFYAAEAERLEGQDGPRGPIVCISPWNFPLAIFTGQISAALAAGNAVIAKPAEQTPLIAARAVGLMHEAGVPKAAIQLLPGDGPAVGAPLTSDPRVAGVCFTGSTEVAQIINRSMAENLDPRAPLIAETGGLNAMIVDSTALPEQAVRDIIASSFQSAGQRCSALRMLYVQEDVADRVLTMLYGAMDELRLGDPWELSTDVGPVIDAEARAGIERHIAVQAAEGRVAKQLKVPAGGLFVPPTVIRLNGIEELEQEIFGPVLHVATFDAEEVDAVIDAVNARGYGLTFGLHTRIDDRVQHIVERVRCGNIYVNRNQIGAVVGSQPFGGEGLSGTGPKAGGPSYVRRFLAVPEADGAEASGAAVGAAAAQAALDGLTVPDWTAEPESLPGPTGESNRLAEHPRGKVLCLGPTAAAARTQAEAALKAGNAALMVAPGASASELEADGAAAALDGVLEPAALAGLAGCDAVASQAGVATLRALRRALAARKGPLVPLVTEPGRPEWFSLERHVCVDTTAAGGNASLLAEAGAA
ncbi:MAG: bifunctional proline dehydrogenase/L-glutamate gamma-semialdehyde dehydrogenase PutA [Kiloniellales bacterium]|nr:bifunctional proline dehydrogenase/L-glutamate gamma-semialdehyde dehydrogenase PutA [Kiloniellales bacterium]